MMRPRHSDDGPILAGATLVKGAAVFALVVALVGYCQDHQIHNANQLLASAWADLRVLGQPDTADGQPAPSRYAIADIPAGYLAAYQHATTTCPHLDWSLLAAIGKQESDHGRSRLPGVHAGTNRAGAAGPMQLGVVGRAGPSWQRYGDGQAGHVYQIRPAARAAARKLCHDGVRAGRIEVAVHAYNPSWRYVHRVLAIAHRYVQQGSR